MRRLLKAVWYALVVLAWSPVRAQLDLFATDTVHEVRLYFAEPDWRARLEALYLVGDEARLTGDVVIDGTRLADVGVRFKGYSSYSPGRLKNPFNIKLNHVHSGQSYQGQTKVKLANAFQDPSFLREALSWEVAERYMAASRWSFANVYVNDTLQGLYTNVEDIGKAHLERSFGEHKGDFFKGNPPTVNLFGENCNLSDTPGADSSAYYGIYELQSDHGWTHLLQLIDTLNHAPERVEEVLDVDRTLWMHALNYALINFDSYVGYAQNYYLYRDADGRWNPILWDLNLSFGAFRLTDCSNYYNGFTIAQAMALDPLTHHNGVSVFPRPLMRNLFANDRWRRMYIAHLRTMVQENLLDGSLAQRAQALHALIDPHVQADPNKFYTYEGFVNNLDQAVTFTASYPGITQLIQGRSAYLSAYPGFTGQPAIGPPAHAPEDIAVGGDLFITASISGADSAFLNVRFKPAGRYQRMALLDDGQHGDGAAGDGVYGARFTAGSNLVEYYIWAENAAAGAFSPERAAFETHRILTRLGPGQLVINELMADNRGAVLDEDGRTPDWVELYNASGATISTAGLYLSDDAGQPGKWALPVKTLAPGEYLVIWCDERPSAGDTHASFKLDAAGESVLLGYGAGQLIDSVAFAQQYPIYTCARFPNGSGGFRRLPPTPKAYNRMLTGFQADAAMQLWPNPASSQLFAIADLDGAFEVEVYRSDGRLVAGPIQYGDRQLIELDTYGLAAGRYLLRARSADAIMTKPFTIVP
jgi:hypothetical protein